MKTGYLYSLCCLICLTTLFGCREHRQEATPDFVRVQNSKRPEKVDPYVEWNRVNVEREDEDIAFFVKRYGWEMEKSGTGLRMQILEEGSGATIQSEDEVTLNYTTLLLTGDTIYSSQESGPKKFCVDKSNEAEGLNEAVKRLKCHGKARLVIPSFLGYGLAGDGQRIKGKVSLAMIIEVVNVE